jgi:hypothetical protein
MKWWMLLLTIGFFSPGVGLCNLTAQPTPSPPAPTGPLQETSREVFERLMEIQVAKDRYEQCSEAGISLRQMDQCLWQAIPGDNDGDQDKVPAPPPGYHEEISQALKSTSEGSSSGDVRVATSAVENLVRTKDPAFVKLQEFLEKRLRTALYNDLRSDIAEEVGKDQNSENTYTVVSQEDFYTLFESQVSKNLIMTVSSYCVQTKEEMGVDENGDSVITGVSYSNESDTVMDNIERLSSQTETHFALAQAHYQACIESIPKNCNPTCTSTDPSQCADPEQVQGRQSRSDANACMVLRSMRAARQQLLEVALIKRRIRQLAGRGTDDIDQNIGDAYLEDAKSKGIAVDDEGPGSTGLFNTSSLDDDVTIRTYQANNQHGSIDRLTSMTSGELNSAENEFNKQNTLQAERFQSECATSLTPEECAEFLVTDLDDQRQKLAELSLRTRSLQELLVQYGDDEEKVRQHLIEEGFSRDAIDSMIASAGSTQNLIGQINEHYDNQRRALVEQVAKLIESRSVDLDDPTNTQNQTNLEKIYEELSNRGNQFTMLLHYNNIVSGFLSITSPGQDDQENRRNTAMIRREMENSFFSPDFQARNPSSEITGTAILEQTHFSNLEQNLTTAQLLTEDEQSNENVGLTLENINNHFLKYFDIPETTP